MTKNIEKFSGTQHPDYPGEIAAIVESNLAPKLMGQRVRDYHEKDIAGALELLPKDGRRKLYSVLDTETLANVLGYAGDPDPYIGALSVRKRVEVLSQMDVGLTVEYLGHLDKSDREMLLDLMEEDVKREITLLSAFDEDEIGSKMTTNFIAIRAGLGVRQAMRALIDQAAEHDNIATLYVVDEDGTFVGAIDLKDLILARDGTNIDAVTMTSYPYVYAGEQIEDCIERIKDYSEDSIPVLDEDNKLRGVLIAQDITQLVDDALGDDYAKLAGLTAEEDLQEPLHQSIRKRLPWLVILLGLGLVVSSVVGLFERVVAHLALIVCFQSLVLDMAGNVGTQSLAVTIRVLMDEQLRGREKLRLVGKEARVGLVNGAILGTLSFLAIGSYLTLLKGQPMALGFGVSFCTGAALLAAMLLSSVVGTVVPVSFKKLGIDPAVASGPLITTINDLVAVTAFTAWPGDC